MAGLSGEWCPVLTGLAAPSPPQATPEPWRVHGSGGARGGGCCGEAAVAGASRLTRPGVCSRNPNWGISPPNHFPAGTPQVLEWSKRARRHREAAPYWLPVADAPPEAGTLYLISLPYQPCTTGVTDEDLSQRGGLRACEWRTATAAKARIFRIPRERGAASGGG